MIRAKKGMAFLFAIVFLFMSQSIFVWAESREQVSSYGLVPEDAASVSSQPAADLLPMANLPAAVDLTDIFPPPGNQGGQNSCVGWAVGYALMSQMQITKRDWSVSSAAHQFSPAYIYNQINANDTGISLTDALDLVCTKGVCSLNYFPYTDEDYSSQPTAIQNAAAAMYKASSWSKVTGIEQIKAQIYNGRGVVIGVKSNTGFTELYAGIPGYVNTDESAWQYHAVCLIGYDDYHNGGAFKLINSWGSDWGLRGYGWISYSAVNSSITNTSGAGVGYILNVSATDPYKLGDVDNSGSVTTSDARMVLRFASRLDTPTAQQYVLADADGDAQVKSGDARAILQYASGAISKLPLYN